MNVIRVSIVAAGVWSVEDVASVHPPVGTKCPRPCLIVPLSR